MRKFRLAALIVWSLAGGVGAMAQSANTNVPKANASSMPFDAKVSGAKAVMMSEPSLALTHARTAVILSRSMPEPQASVGIATGRWLEGEALTRLNRPKQAKPVIDKALSLVLRHQPNTKLHGDILKSAAAVAMLTGEVQPALEILHDAYEIFAALGELRSQAIVLQNIGSIYSDARDYPRVLRYYEQANDIFSGDAALSISSHNNRGNAFKEMGEFGKAETEYSLALNLAKSLDSPLLEARIITNVASAQFLSGNLRQADATAARGLVRATGAAKDWRPYLWGVRAQVAFARGKVPLAIDLIERTFEGVDLAKTTMLYRSFHETAGLAYAASGRDRQAFAHLYAFKRLDDATRDLAASTESALLSARFDAANQALRIARLKAGQLQRDMKLTESEQRLSFITSVGMLGTLAAVLIIGAISLAFFAVRRSRSQVSEAHAQLTLTARRDGLTGLANRSQLRTLLDEALVSHSKNSTRCALLLIDLDRFKAVNDTLGHRAGDALLCTIARRLEDIAGSACHAGRLGGDEFAIILSDVSCDADLEAFADRVIADLSLPCSYEGSQITVGATIGIAAGPLDGATVDAITRSADLALYRAKSAGRGCWVRYEPAMQAEADERILLESDLRTALAEQQLEIAYQPIVDAKNCSILAYEALLRWNHPTRGAISPSVFIPIAEEAKLISQIGAWVLRSACMEAVSRHDGSKVAVNVSANQVEGGGFSSTVMSALAMSGLAPERLELEVTESIFLRQGSRTDATLSQLRELGVSLALDDFGTGYSSLGYLQRGTFSTIKIDRSFVQAAAAGRQESIAIIRAIVALAEGLGMETTAEGVETDGEATAMRSLGCSQFQGYHFGRPATTREAQSETLRQVA